MEDLGAAVCRRKGVARRIVVLEVAGLADTKAILPWVEAKV